MTFIEGMRAFLVATPAVTAIVGATNLFPAQGAQGASPPKVVYERDYEKDDETLTGGAIGMPVLRGRLLCYGGRWGTGYTTARLLADALKAADGGLGGRTLQSFVGYFSTVRVMAFRFENDQDKSEPAKDASGMNQQWVELSFVATYIKQ